MTTGKSQVEYYFLGCPEGRNYSRGIYRRYPALLKNQSEQLPAEKNL